MKNALLKQIPLSKYAIALKKKLYTHKSILLGCPHSKSNRAMYNYVPLTDST